MERRVRDRAATAEDSVRRVVVSAVVPHATAIAAHRGVLHVGEIGDPPVARRAADPRADPLAAARLRANGRRMKRDRRTVPTSTPGGGH